MSALLKIEYYIALLKIEQYVRLIKTARARARHRDGHDEHGELTRGGSHQVDEDDRRGADECEHADHVLYGGKVFRNMCRNIQEEKSG